ncbi:MAG TPA: ornithine cyclodeaminase family protein [Acetobacteraceae bacterium]|nr:ornithine cyclodeaminase family protein [Acetobacteraceae bacterium]
MRFADAQTVHHLLDYRSLVDALRMAHHGSRPRIERLQMQDPAGGADQFLALAAWAGGEAIAVKLVGVFPGNAGRDPPQPSVQGTVVLFDGTTGAARLAADGAAMTERKTAADSALGMELLSRQDAATLLVVGAGALAPHMILAAISVRPSLRRVLVWNRTPARAEALAAHTALAGIEVSVARELDAAVARADIITCVTMATAPLIRGTLLRPGSHVDLTGSYLPSMREADDEVMRRGRIYVDDRAALEHAGDLTQPLAAGVIAPAQVVGDLWQLCTGAVPGRHRADEITVYKNIGGAHLDLFTSEFLLGRLEPPPEAG